MKPTPKRNTILAYCLHVDTEEQSKWRRTPAHACRDLIAWTQKEWAEYPESLIGDTFVVGVLCAEWTPEEYAELKASNRA